MGRAISQAYVCMTVAVWLSACEGLDDFAARWDVDEPVVQAEARKELVGEKKPGHELDQSTIEARVVSDGNAVDSPPASIDPEARDPLLYPGTDKFVSAASRKGIFVAEADTDGTTLVLNFENAELRDVVAVVLGDTLKANYVFDPRVTGLVTLQTSEAIPRSAVLATLETVLRMNGAALVHADDVYRVVPANEAVSGNLVPQLGTGSQRARAGYGVRILPLRYVSAMQMEKLLEPFLPSTESLRIDTDRNLLVLFGTGQELDNLVATAGIFDVDWLSGLSVGIFPLENIGPDVLGDELSHVFGDEAQGPLAGLIRFVPVERLNALMVVTQRASLLEQADKWIRRLDRTDNITGHNIYVYYVQNAKAADLAETLSQVFAKASSSERLGQRDLLAPGRQPVVLRSRESGPTQPSPPDESPDSGRPQPPERYDSSPIDQSVATLRARTGGGLGTKSYADVSIIADEIINALIIMATPQDYRTIEAALNKLDILPLQVLIEATIAEVTLGDDLRYGLQYFFEEGKFTTTLSNVAGGAVASTFPGFSTVYSTSDTRIILDALESITTLNVISSPQLVVLDNQSAQLEVGDEVPVTTQQSVSTADAAAPLVSTIEYRDTGVILTVTPRINTGGLVTMEIEQEVSNVSQNVSTGALTPTISQRRVKSTVAVQSGETVVLGGLIEETQNTTKSGIPFLMRIPVLGALFGTRGNMAVRTELIVFLTPRVIHNQDEAREITEEVRRKLQSLKPYTEILRRSSP